MKIMCKCRNCSKVYEETKARGDWKGYCSAKCQHEKAKTVGYRKGTSGGSEYDHLNNAKAVGSVYVVQVTVPGASKPDWREVQQITPASEQLKCPECGKKVGWYVSTATSENQKTKLHLHDDPKGNRCPGGGLWTSLVPGAFEAAQDTQDQQADAEDDAKRPARTALREQFRSYITDKLKEYIDEAEHQDGEGYWDNFQHDGDNAVTNVVADFIVYLENLEGL